MAGVQSVHQDGGVQTEAPGVRAPAASPRQPRALRVALVNPPSPDGHIYIRDVNRSGRLSREGTIWPQTSLALIAAVLDKAGCQVQVWDCIATKTNYQQLYKELQEWNPTHVLIESVSSTIPHDMVVAHYAKYLGAQTILISPHGEALADETQCRFPVLDHVVHYEKHDEPEYAIRELITGQPRRAGEDFSTLPRPRHDLLPVSYYDLPLIGRGYTFVLTSRGCPWKCIYCRQTVTWKSRVRYRSPESIVEEIQYYHLTNIAFHADTATVNRKQMLAICKGIQSLPWKVRWICNSRVDTVDLEMLKAMKSAGCWMICYGIESGDDRVLAMNKKEATVADAIQAVKWAKTAGLKVWGYFMLALYGDTPDSMQQTINLACSLPLDIANFAISAPYPGTEWGRIASERGWLVDNRWEAYDQNYQAIVDQPSCNHATVLKYQRRAYLRWYGSWRGVKFLLNAWRPRYSKFLFRIAMNHGRI